MPEHAEEFGVVKVAVLLEV
uniref:Uncharacterized protein n=1 Tax=Arundo donax TaxID=35708 RepID=A0A0A9CAM2_ARUDO